LSWIEDSQAIADAWVQAQKTALESWASMMGVGSAGASPAAPSAGNGAADPSNSGAKSVEHWHELATKSIEQWTAGGVPFIQEIAKRALAGQETMTRLATLFAETWKDVAPRAEAGEDWSAALARHTERARKQFLQSPAQFVEAGKDAAELWRLYLEQLGHFSKPWTESFSQSQRSLKSLAAGDRSAASEMSGLFWNAYERTLGKLIDMPSLGLSREFHEKATRAFDSWIALRRSTLDYQSLMADAWGRAYERFVRTLIDRGEKHQSVSSLRELFALWIEEFDDEYMQFFRSDAYIAAQSMLVKASMTQRIREREILEAFMKMRGLPTPSDIDDANRRIYELGKEVKALKKRLDEREGQA
jgi:class III poly(R)-hydroxyalkanoic acid synthase PhaE subunit